MRLINYALLALLSLLMCTDVSPAQEQATVLPNPGFEQKLNSWSTGNSEVTITKEAAHEGEAGMRIDVKDNLPTGTSIYSSGLPVKAGDKLTLSFWARSKGKPFCGVYIYFRNAKGRNVKINGKGQLMIATGKTNGEWKKYEKEMTTPEGAEYVILWLHTWGGAKGVIDFDDFSITGVAKDVKPIAPPKAKPTKKLVIPDISELPERKAPPVIILKFDDLRPIRGKVHSRWKNLDKYLSEKNIKYTAGVICKDLPTASPEFCQWVKERHENGTTEFWLHAWDHKTHKVDDGATYSEFGGRQYDEQFKRFSDCQKAAAEKLGFNFVTFGPPGGGRLHFDSNTCKVMADDPNIKVWLYSQPIDKKGKELVAAGKITILDRVWAVNLEGAVGVPSYGRLLAGYAKYPDRAYFVLQGHPMAWNDERFEEFKKIIEFLQSQNAVFVIPAEYAQTLQTENKTPDGK